MPQTIRKLPLSSLAMCRGWGVVTLATTKRSVPAPPCGVNLRATMLPFRQATTNAPCGPTATTGSVPAGSITISEPPTWLGAKTRARTDGVLPSQATTNPPSPCVEIEKSGDQLRVTRASSPSGWPSGPYQRATRAGVARSRSGKTTTNEPSSIIATAEFAARSRA